MSRISTAELREKEIINLCGGEKLGYSSDFEFDAESERITSLIVPVNNGISWFGKREEYIIPWCKVECIGEDTILVRIPQNELLAVNGARKSKTSAKKKEKL